MNIAALQVMLSVQSHVGVRAGFNWEPWTNRPYREAIGWKGTPHRGGKPVYLYLLPDLDAEVPSFHVYSGPHGDIDRDELLDYIRLGEPEGEPEP